MSRNTNGSTRKLYRLIHIGLAALAMMLMVSPGFAAGTQPPSSQPPQSPSATCPPDGQCFADVPSGNTFFTFINRIYQQDLVSGYACGGPGEPCDAYNRPYYRPVANVTRSQMAKFIDNGRRLPQIHIETASPEASIYVSSTGDTGLTGAIYAETYTGTALYGKATGGGFGVRAEGIAYGTYSTSEAGYGVWGASTTGSGVVGTSTSGFGIYGSSSTNGEGVHGYSFASNGVHGESGGTNAAGVLGVNDTSSGFGVKGTSTSTGYGVYGQSNGGYGVEGISNDNGLGVFGFNTANGIGVHGLSSTGDGMHGESNGTFGAGVSGIANGSNAHGVVGTSSGGSNSSGIYGEGTSGSWAGYFSGDVNVTGTCCGAGAGSFRIDDPLDPANQYLYHSAVESADMMNLYNGNVTTDANGDATIQLPAWFDPLNRDFRYQLTPIGQFAQAMVSSEIRDNHFSIKTDKPNVKVSWQVTGIRQDPYANAHRIPVEEEKTANEQGKYLYPTEYGQPQSSGIDYQTHQRLQHTTKSKP
jgi:hypothetical protein